MRAITKTVRKKHIGRYPKRLRPMIEGRRNRAKEHWVYLHSRAVGYVMERADKGLVVSATKMARDLHTSKESAQKLINKFTADKISFKAEPNREEKAHISSFVRNQILMALQEEQKTIKDPQKQIRRFDIEIINLKRKKAQKSKIMALYKRKMILARGLQKMSQINLNKLADALRINYSTARRIAAELRKKHNLLQGYKGHQQ